MPIYGGVDATLGYSSASPLLDAEGAAVEGATVTASLLRDGVSIWSDTATTDVNGVGEINVPDFEMVDPGTTPTGTQVIRGEILKEVVTAESGTLNDRRENTRRVLARH